MSRPPTTTPSGAPRHPTPPAARPDPVSPPPPPASTRAKIRWDDEYIYIAGEMEEPDVWANVTTHDTVVCNDNDFEVFINPDGTTHNYKEYEMNALATVWNLFLNKPYTDGGWEHSARSMGPRGFDMMTADPPLRSAAKVYGPLNWPLVKNGAENVVDGKAVGCKGSFARAAA